MKEIMYGDETVKVLAASGYNDGYYWDMNAKIEFKGETYSLFDAGSGSGSKSGFDKGSAEDVDYEVHDN